MVTLLLLACTGAADPPAESDTPSGETGDTSGDSGGGTRDPTDTADTRAPVDTGDAGEAADPDDRDADGVRSDAGDCDDDDARVFPGAPDACDAVDQDCDGRAQPEGACGELVMLDDASVGVWVGDGAGSALSIHEADTDYDGDGIEDILAWSFCTSWRSDRYCNMNVVLLPGRMPAGEEVAPTSDARFWIADPAHDWTSDFGNAGDVDGDGSTDLFVAARGCAPDDGSLYVMLGPSSRWPAAGAMTRSAADGWWSQAEPDDCFADAASGGHDFDGDGLDDLMVTGAQVAFVRGRAALERGLPIRDEIWYLGGTERFALLPDLDGDGLAEAAMLHRLEGEHALGYVTPSMLLDGAASGAALVDVSDVVSLGQYAGVDFLAGRSDVGDVNGDGAVDVAVHLFRDETDEGVSDQCFGILFGGTHLRTSTLDDEVGRLVCIDGAVDAAQDPDRITDDVDADGVGDLLVNTPYADARAGWQGCVIPSTRRPEAGWAYLEEVRPYCFDAEGERNFNG
ncbi:MAG: putative metal-binding motif-containing protein, partial [Myxococcota bacterium]